MKIHWTARHVNFFFREILLSTCNCQSVAVMSSRYVSNQRGFFPFFWNETNFQYFSRLRKVFQNPLCPNKYLSFWIFLSGCHSMSWVFRFPGFPGLPNIFQDFPVLKNAWPKFNYFPEPCEHCVCGMYAEGTFESFSVWPVQNWLPEHKQKFLPICPLIGVFDHGILKQHVHRSFLLGIFRRNVFFLLFGFAV